MLTRRRVTYKVMRTRPAVRACACSARRWHWRGWKAGDTIAAAIGHRLEGALVFEDAVGIKNLPLGQDVRSAGQSSHTVADARACHLGRRPRPLSGFARDSIETILSEIETKRVQASQEAARGQTPLLTTISRTADPHQHRTLSTSYVRRAAKYGRYLPTYHPLPPSW